MFVKRYPPVAFRTSSHCTTKTSETTFLLMFVQRFPPVALRNVITLDNHNVRDNFPAHVCPTIPTCVRRHTGQPQRQRRLSCSCSSHDLHMKDVITTSEKNFQFKFVPRSPPEGLMTSSHRRTTDVRDATSQSCRNDNVITSDNACWSVGTEVSVYLAPITPEAPSPPHSLKCV